MLAGRRILLIVGGGIAAFKTPELVRRLTGAGAAVTPVLTRAAEQFVTPLTLSTLAGEAAHTALFDLTREAEIGHIQLSRAADLVVVAPATADLMAKMANGIADDLATTLLLATDKRVLIAPAMNVRMWDHAATRRNRATLEADGILFVGPGEGSMACGEYGAGRMSEPAEIVAAAEAALGEGPLKGRHVLVTSGPTHEPIDPVRYIANRSSGAQGTAIAAALAGLGARVTFVTGPAEVPPPAGVQVQPVETAARDAGRRAGRAAGGCGGVRGGGGGLACHECDPTQDEEGRQRPGAGAGVRREPRHPGHCFTDGGRPARAGGGFRRRDRRRGRQCHRQAGTQGLRLDRRQ